MPRTGKTDKKIVSERGAGNLSAEILTLSNYFSGYPFSDILAENTIFKKSKENYQVRILHAQSTDGEFLQSHQLLIGK
ncbi:MAG: hypothetical protein OEM01_01585 [Desulfobulbaceae bacterium]|nr:hypothetical protein [Desulfobulbaceae bacterium]